MANSPGYGTSTGTGLVHEILANNDFVLNSITIDTSTRDAGNATTTNLRRGLLLAPDSAHANRYILANHATGTINHDQAVVLCEDVFDIDDGHQVAASFWRCTLKNGMMIDPNSAIGQTAYALAASRLLIDEQQTT